MASKKALAAKFSSPCSSQAAPRFVVTRKRTLALAVIQTRFPGGLQFKPVSQLVAAMTAEQTRPDEQHLVPMTVVHSSNDGTVPLRTAITYGTSGSRATTPRSTPRSAIA